MELSQLKMVLSEADRFYYDLDDPQMSDAEYDELCKEYYSKTGKKWNEDKVPGNISEKFAPVTHTYKAKSLDKINTEEELRKEIKRLAPGVIQWKYDGLTLVVYPDGRVLTRGNGEIGEDVTHTAGFITRRKGKINLPIRGEAFIRKSTFKQINEERVANGEEPYKNLRNAAAGMIRNLDSSKVTGIDFVAYNVLGSTETETQQDAMLDGANYCTPSHFDFGGGYIWVFTNSEKGINETVAYVKHMEAIRDTLDFEVDGLVIKSNKPNAVEYFGETSHHFKNAVAYKFESQGVWTKLKSVRWTVGRTGKIVPNADVEPVDILNTTVRKASIHNASMLARKGLCEGCEVFLVKANDIIPDIQDVRGGNPDKPFVEPTDCPTCKTKLRVQDSKDNEGVYQLYCDNPDCSSKTVLRVVHMAQRDALDIDGLSIETATKMYDDMLIDKPEDIFNLTVSGILSLDGFASPSAKKLYNAIQAKSEASLARFLYAAGVPTIGKSKSEELANEFGNYDDFIKDVKTGCKRIHSMNGFGTELISNIIKYRNLWENLRKHVTPQAEEKKKKAERQLTFVITGTLPQKRKYYEDIVKGAGHKVSGSVSKKTDYLLAGEDCGGKLDDANKCGTKIISDVVIGSQYKLQDLESLL